MKTVIDAVMWLARFFTRRHAHDESSSPSPSGLRIVSDGTPQGTSITLDGVPLDRYTRSLMWSVHADDPLAIVTLEFDAFSSELDVVDTMASAATLLDAQQLLVRQASTLVADAREHHQAAARQYGYFSVQAESSRKALRQAQETYGDVIQTFYDLKGRLAS